METLERFYLKHYFQPKPKLRRHAHISLTTISKLARVTEFEIVAMLESFPGEFHYVMGCYRNTPSHFVTMVARGPMNADQYAYYSSLAFLKATVYSKVL